MRALVTGATTPLGRAIVAALVADPSVEHVLATGIEPHAPRLAPSDRVTYALATWPARGRRGS